MLYANNILTQIIKNDFVKNILKAMDDIGVVMTSFGDVVTVSLVANSYVVGFFC